MKLVFLDTEFTGEHAFTTLVSIGMVTLGGDELYLNLDDYDESQVTDWLKENVIKFIPPSNRINSNEAAIKVDRFLKDYSNGEKVHFVSVGKTSDILLTYELWKYFKEDPSTFHSLYDLPDCISHSDHFDLCTLLNVVGISMDNFNRVEYAQKDFERMGGRHNPLYDSHILRECFLRLIKEKEEFHNLRERVFGE